MPNNKNFLRRIRVIDRELQGGIPKSIGDIMAAYNKGVMDDEKVTSKTTFLNDIHEMESKFGAYIPPQGRGKNTRYCYEDPNFSIFDVPLKDYEIIQLSATLQMLSRYQDLPCMDWLDTLIERMKLAGYVDVESTKVVSFDHNPYLKGLEHYRPLVEAASKERAIKVAYHNFRGADFTFTLHPYHVAQYNKRWFVIGWDEEFGKIGTFAFDRIVSITPSTVAFHRAPDFNAEAFPEEIVGVSRPAEAKEEHIELWVSANTTPYIETKPLHGSQRIVRKNADGTSVIALDLIINYEFRQLLLSYGKDIIVLMPETLRTTIGNVLNEASSLYPQNPQQ